MSLARGSRPGGGARGLVDSVVGSGELGSFRLVWVTPWAYRWDDPDAAWIVWRPTVAAGDNR